VAFERIGSLEDLDDGAMHNRVTATGTPVLLVRLSGGALKAFQAYCPHQRFELAHGCFDGTTLTCAGHCWQFDARTGNGVEPTNCRLAEYPTRVDGTDIYVDVTNVEPLMAGH